MNKKTVGLNIKEMKEMYINKPLAGLEIQYS